MRVCVEGGGSVCVRACVCVLRAVVSATVRVWSRS